MKRWKGNFLKYLMFDEIDFLYYFAILTSFSISLV